MDRLCELPVGTVTLMFCDVEGSTALARRLGEGWPPVLGGYRELLRQAIRSHDGFELGTEGDGFVAAFSRARDAVSASVDAQRALAAHEWPFGATVSVRMGLHTGEPTLTAEGYEGLDMHRAARVMAAGHGGQVLLTGATRATVGDRLPAGVVVSELGEHTLKDFPRPEPLFQLAIDGLRATFPSLRTVSSRRSTSLPIPPTALVGRDDEVARLAALLRERDVRLVTLTGPGGVGKTRLALEVARRSAPAHLVLLASVPTARLVTATLLRSLGVVDGGDAPAADALVAALANERLLLVLDNFEHLLDAAPLVAELLGACPRLSVLATSREPLRVRGEKLFTVSPLRRRAATELFVERAIARDPTFEVTPATARTVANICQRVDGLPLAIELAAARVGLLGAEELAARLGAALEILGPGARDAPPRHQTLRATMDWSYRLLDGPERDVFSALAVFPGGCTLAAAETVVAALLPTLDSLLTKHLLVRRSGRLAMLETVREYANERLAERADADAIHRRHAEYFCELADRARPRLRLADQDAVTGLDVEIDNLRGALAWLADNDRRLLCRLAASLGDYWELSHRQEEGRQWVDAALTGDARCAAPGLAADLLLARARLSDRFGGSQDASEALSLFEQANNSAGASECLALLSRNETARTRWSAADAFADRAVAKARKAGDDLLIGEALHVKSMAQIELSEAAPIAEGAVAHLRRAGAPAHVANVLATTGWIAIEAEAYDRADELLNQAGAAATAARDIGSVAMVRGNQGLSAVFQGQMHTAADAFREQLALCRSFRFATRIFAWEGLMGLAAVAAAGGDLERAARLAGSADACTENPYALAEAPVFDRLTERFLDPARAKLGTTAWGRAYHNASGLDVDEAVAAALDDTTIPLARPADHPARR